MKRVYALLTLVMLTIAAAGQTLNVRVGSVVYQFPADQTGEMTYSGGTTLTVMRVCQNRHILLFVFLQARHGKILSMPLF